MLKGALLNLLYKKVDEASLQGNVTKLRVPLFLYVDMCENGLIEWGEEDPIIHLSSKVSGKYYSVDVEMSPELQLSCEVEKYKHETN